MFVGVADTVLRPRSWVSNGAVLVVVALNVCGVHGSWEGDWRRAAAGGATRGCAIDMTMRKSTPCQPMFTHTIPHPSKKTHGPLRTDAQLGHLKQHSNILPHPPINNNAQPAAATSLWTSAQRCHAPSTYQPPVLSPKNKQTLRTQTLHTHVPTHTHAHCTARRALLRDLDAAAATLPLDECAALRVRADASLKASGETVRELLQEITGASAHAGAISVMLLKVWGVEGQQGGKPARAAAGNSRRICAKRVRAFPCRI